MGGLFIWFLGAAILCVVISLTMGVFYMSKEGIENRQKSLKMMKARVYLQGLALLLVALALLSA